MPELTSKQTIALAVAALASIGRAVLAFAPDRFPIGLLTVLAVILFCMALVALIIFPSTQRRGRAQRVLRFLVPSAVAWWLLLLFSQSRPEHIVILSIAGILLGFPIGMLLYHSLGNHLKDGIIIYEGTVLYQVTSISLTVAGAVSLYLMAVMSPRHGVMLVWLLMCALAAYFLYLTVAVLLLERKTGQKIRFAYPQEMSRGRLVVMIVWFIAIIGLLVILGLR